ncbi:MAG: PDZ domain-containing protein [Acidimicrobiales bacterium]
MVVIVVTGATMVVVRGAKQYYALSPGTAPLLTTDPGCKLRPGAIQLVLPDGTPCARLGVPAAKLHPISGELRMVDVLVAPATPTEFLLNWARLLGRFHDGKQLVPASAILGRTPRSQIGCEDTQQMTGSTEEAAVVALRAVGYQVGENDQGAQIDVVEPGSSAAKAGIQCNDLVIAVGATAVKTAADVVKAIHAAHPGDRIAITVRRIDPHGVTTVRALQARLTGTPALRGQGPADPAKAFLGVTAEPRLTFQLPFNVTVDVGAIGGPSAGLSLTLGLIDVLSGGQLTGGHAVAATGTINFDGSVGDVGGVAQKTVAVRRSGAQLFLVPKGELAEARREAGPHLQVVAVSTLSDALAALARAGGHVPPVSPQPAA